MNNEQTKIAAPWLADRENNGRFRTGILMSLPAEVSSDVLAKISELRYAYLEAVEEIERLRATESTPGGA